MMMNFLNGYRTSTNNDNGNHGNNSNNNSNVNSNNTDHRGTKNGNLDKDVSNDNSNVIIIKDVDPKDSIVLTDTNIIDINESEDQTKQNTVTKWNVVVERNNEQNVARKGKQNNEPNSRQNRTMLENSNVNEQGISSTRTKASLKIVNPYLKRARKPQQNVVVEGTTNSITVTKANAGGSNEPNTGSNVLKHSTGTVRTLCSRSILQKQSHDHTAIQLYNQLKEHTGNGHLVKNFEDLTYQDVVNDNVIYIVTEHCHRLTTTLVPKGWNKKDGWNQDKPDYLSCDTVVKYVEPLFQILQSSFPTHPKLVGHKDRPAWWLEVKANLRRGYTGEKLKGLDEEYDPKCATLFITNKPLLTPYRVGQMNYLEKADLFHINDSLMQSAKQYGCRNYELRAQLLTSAMAVSRGGECKWMRFSYFQFDPRYSVTDTSWCELKTGNFYSMPMVNFADPSKFQVDWYNAMACACAVDDSILNRSNDVNHDFVWLNLHKIEDSSVARLLSREAKKHLPDDMPADVKTTYTTKMWRKGGTTQLAHHRQLEMSHACARSGHKMYGNHFDTYVSNAGIGLSLPAAMALNEYEDCHAIPTPASFDLLPTEQKPGMEVISKIVSEFLPSNLPDFQPKGRLWKMVEIMTASVIMAYNNMVKHLGEGDPVVHKLQNIFKGDSQLGLTSLRKWSSTMHAAFILSNDRPQVMKSANAVQLIDSMNQLNVNMSMLKHKQQETVQLNQELTSKFECLMGKLDSVLEQNKQLVDENKKLRQLLTTPPPSPKKRKYVDNEAGDNICVQQEALPGVMAGAAATRIPPVLVTDNPISKQDIKGVTIQDCLKLLYESPSRPIQNHVKDDGTFMLHTLGLPFVKNNKNTFYSALEVVFIACTRLQLQQMKQQLLSGSDIDELTKAIQDQAMDLLHRVEGRQAVESEDSCEKVKKKGKKKPKKNSSRELKPFLLGFGRRALKYKKDFHGAKSYTDKRMWDCLNEIDFPIPSMQKLAENQLSTQQQVEVEFVAQQVSPQQEQERVLSDPPLESPVQRMKKKCKQYYGIFGK